MTAESDAPKRVFILDDDVDLPNLLSEMLVEYNPDIKMTFRLIHSFGDATTALQEEIPHILFLNPTLKDRWGNTLYEMKRNDGSPLVTSPVVVITGGISPSVEADFRQHGVIDIMRKPDDFNEPTIQSVTHRALNSGKLNLNERP